jgi:hypothetical protein
LNINYLPHAYGEYFSNKELRETVLDIQINGIEKEIKSTVEDLNIKDFNFCQEILSIAFGREISDNLTVLIEMMLTAKCIGAKTLISHHFQAKRYLGEYVKKENLRLIRYPDIFVGSKYCKDSYFYDEYYYRGLFYRLKMNYFSIRSEFYNLVKFLLKIFVKSKKKKSLSAGSDFFSLVCNPKTKKFNDIPFAKDLKEEGKTISIMSLGTNAKNILESFSSDATEVYESFVEIYCDFPRKIRLSFLQECLYLHIKFLLVFILKRNRNLSTSLYKLSSSQLLMRYFFKENKTKIFWSNIEGLNENLISCCMAASNLGIHTAGFTWSMPLSRDNNSRIYRNDIFFSWGSRQQNLIKQSNAKVKKHIISGYPINLISANNKKSIEVKKKELSWLLYLDNLPGFDLPLTPDIQISFLENLFSILKRNKNYGLIIKSKKKDLSKYFLPFSLNIKDLEDEGRFMFNYDYGEFNPDGISNMVLFCSYTSLGFVSYASGLPVVSYDPDNNLQDIKDLNFEDFLIIDDLANLEEAIIKSLSSSEGTICDSYIIDLQKEASKTIMESLKQYY